MNLHADITLEETHAIDAAAATTTRLPDALDDMMPVVLKRDFISLLLQSPHRLYLYWTFAHDPHVTLREAFGRLAAHYRLAVRLINVESGEEFLQDASRERAQWFEVYPRHVYRAEVGFHAPGRPFVRLLSSNAVTTPRDRASHLSDAAEEFQLGANEFSRLLGGAGYERYARELSGDAGGGGTKVDDRRGGVVVTAERPDAGMHPVREEADEYPHR